MSAPSRMEETQFYFYMRCILENHLKKHFGTENQPELPEYVVHHLVQELAKVAHQAQDRR